MPPGVHDPNMNKQMRFDLAANVSKIPFYHWMTNEKPVRIDQAELGAL